MKKTKTREVLSCEFDDPGFTYQIEDLEEIIKEAKEKGATQWIVNENFDHYEGLLGYTMGFIETYTETDAEYDLRIKQEQEKEAIEQQKQKDHDETIKRIEINQLKHLTMKYAGIDLSQL